MPGTVELCLWDFGSSKRMWIDWRYLAASRFALGLMTPENRGIHEVNPNPLFARGASAAVYSHASVLAPAEHLSTVILLNGIMCISCFVPITAHMHQ